MKCRKCSSPAAIKMLQHNMALCKDHFLEWIPQQTQRFIEKYEMFTTSERLLLAVSGGKDSLALWDVLWKLGYKVDGLYLNLGINDENDYSTRSKYFCEKFANQRNLDLHVIDIKEIYSENIPEIAARTKRGKTKPCSVCGLVKRYVLNKYTLDHDYDVLITAHNLDDEAAFLFNNTMSWSFTYLGRQYPVLPSTSGFVRKVKPFCRFYERETTAYCLMNKIEYIYDECPFSVGGKQIKNKQILNRLEDEHPALKYQFYTGYLRAVKAGVFPSRQQSASELEKSSCVICGQPTTSGSKCAFCIMMKH